MKIFFFTTYFSPSIGGIERMAETLCDEFVQLGHEVRLATMTPGGGDFPYPVIRRPSVVDFHRLVRWCDVHIQANVALKYAWPRFCCPGNTIYQHNNAYQRDDGTRSLPDLIKAAIARGTSGIANSHYTARRTGARYVVFNAYDNGVFLNTTPWAERERDFVFLGRLVSQKGCDTLLHALACLKGSSGRPNLTVIGDGPDRSKLEQLSETLGLAEQVRFLGSMQGTELAAMLNRHRVLVVPSTYEEPFGIVALEGLACGCVPIVSERGGLVDAISGHGFTFPNGDAAALAGVMARVLSDPAAARARLDGVEAHLQRCSARSVAEQYLEIFREKTGVR